MYFCFVWIISPSLFYSFLSIYLLRLHNTTHLSQSLTCLMACWTFSRLMSLASFSSVFSSIFNIDTLYWHSSTTTTSGCTARMVCSEAEQEQWARKIRHRVWESNRKIGSEGGSADKTINVEERQPDYAQQNSDASLIMLYAGGWSSLQCATV